MAAGHRGQFTPVRLPVNTVTHTTLVGLEPATFRSLVRRATSSATEPTSNSLSFNHEHIQRQVLCEFGLLSISVNKHNLLSTFHTGLYKHLNTMYNIIQIRKFSAEIYQLVLFEKTRKKYNYTKKAKMQI